MPATFDIHVGGDSRNVFDDARLRPRFKLEVVGPRMSLIAHLGNDATARSKIHKTLTLSKGMGEWFLYKYVLTERHGEHGSGKVRMIGGSDEDSVDVIGHIIEHFPKIRVSTCLYLALFWYCFAILHNWRLVSESMDVACLMGMGTVHINVAECDDITQSRA